MNKGKNKNHNPTHIWKLESIISFHKEQNSCYYEPGRVRKKGEKEIPTKIHLEKKF